MQVLKETLIGFDRRTTYKVYIKDQIKVIQVKNLKIFEDYQMKKSIELSDYSKSLFVFQGFLYINKEEKQELPVPQVRQKVEGKKVKCKRRKTSKPRILKKPKGYRKSVNIYKGLYK